MKNFDLLGRNISLRLQKSSIYQTRFGALVTIGILVLISLRLTYIFENNFSRPQIIFQERLVDETQQSTLSPKQFSFAIGVTKDSLNYENNNKIFTIEANLIVKSIQLNKNTQQNETIQSSQSFSLEKCTKNHFQIDGANDPIKNQKLEQQLCFPIDQKLLLKGDMNSESMTYLSLKLKRCTGLVCEDSKIIDEFMKNNFVELYISDTYFSPEDKNSPYKYYGRKLNYFNSVNFSKVVYINLKNNYIESDIGIFKKNIQSDNFLSYSYAEDHIIDKTDDYVSNFIIKFDQKIENFYKRSYQKMILIIPEIGGLTFVLYCISLTFISFYQNIQFNQKLIRTTFTFNEVKQGVRTQTEHQTKQNREKTQTIPLIGQELFSDDRDAVRTRGNSNQSQRDYLLQNDPQQKDSKTVLKQRDTQPTAIFDQYNQPFDKFEEIKQLFDEMNEHLQNIEQLEQKSQQGQKPMKQKIFDSKKIKQYKDKIKAVKKKISLAISESQGMSFSFFEYLSSSIFKFKQSLSKKTIMEECTQQLYKYMDIQFLIQKLNEIDLLKKILLNEDQQIMFQFLAKPCINYLKVNDEYILPDKENKIQQLDKYQEECEKLMDGIDSYKKIMSLENLEKVDTNLLKNLDQKYLLIFKDQLERKRAAMNKLQQQPSIIVHKSPKQFVNKKNYIKQGTDDSSHFLSVHQSIFMSELIPKKQKNPQKLKANNQTPIHINSVMMNFQDYDMSCENMINIDQEAHNNIQENIKIYSSNGCLQKPQSPQILSDVPIKIINTS